MKKRALSWLLALTMLLTLAPQTLPVWASATGEKSNTATQTESKLSANTYSALGLSRNVADSEKPKDQPYGKAEVGNTIATNVINELYVNFNGSIHYGWSILDNIPMEYRDDCGGNWTNSRNFYGAMGYWRPNQQTVNYGSGSSSNGALFAKQGSSPQNGGVHDDHLGKSINSANKHLTYQYSKSEAFSPNTGKDNYVAEMTIDSASKVYLYIYQVEGGNKRYVRSKFVCDASPSGGDANDKANIIYNWEYDAMYDIAAGDMDGDGYDEIAVYAQNKVYVYSFKGGNLSSSPIATHDVTPPKGTSDDAGYKKLKTAVVTLAFGDLNADDKDELVIAENIGYGATNIDTGKVGIYRLETNESTKKNTLVKAMKDDILLAVPGSSGIFNAGPMVRYANVATGDIDGDYQDELVIAGYISSKMPNATCNRGDIAYMIVKGGSDNQFTHSDWKAVDKNKNRIDLLDRVVDNNNQLIPPVALTCAATQGVGYAEQVFLGGYLYSVTGANEQKTNVENYSLNALTRISTNREYKKDNGNKANKEEIFVVNVVAGNFNGNRNGQEQIVYAFGMKHDDSDRYWYDIGYINKKEPGDTNANSSSGYWYGQEQVMNYESSYNRDQNKSRASLYLSLAAVDCDNDSTLMRYKGKTVTWTKPEVLTILQSAPYFQDLQDTRDYINQGQTAYGKGSSSGTSGTAGGSLKLGTYVSFEQDFSVFGVKVASIEAEAQSTHAFTYDYEHTKTKELNITYSGSAGDDYAVVYAVPYMEYQYETWVPGYKLPDNRDEYNKYLDEYIRNTRGKNKVDSDNNASASITITQADRDKVATELGIGPGTEVKGSWQPSSVMVPMDPAKVILSVDDYDAIAEQTEGLEPIRGNILNSTPGDPLTYDGENVNKGFTAIGDWQTMTKAEGTNISLESSTTVSEEHTFAYNYEFEAKAGAGAGGVTVGVLAGFGTSAGGGVSTSNSTSYSATVDNLPKDADGYTLSWQFGYRTAKLNNNDVLVLEYRQKNAHAKPSLPQNLRVNSVTANSVTLSWDPVVGSGAYEIYQVSTTDSNTKYLRARVPGTAESYTDTRVTPGSSYTYCVKNITQAGEESIYSTNVVATTLTDTNGKFVINQQPESKITTYAGGTTTATIDAEYLDKNGDPQTLDYFWERYDSATKTWKYIGKGTTLSVSVPSNEKQADAMDGTKYRCQVFYNSNLYIYSEPVTLTIGKANSATTLTSDNTSPTVNASYVKTETVETSEQADVPVTETKDNKTYTKYKVKDDTTEKIVYIDEDGKYYTSNNGTVGSLITPDETNVQLTYAVKTTKTVGGVATTEVDIKTIQFSSLTKQTPTEGETITYTSKDEDGTSITTYADCTVLAKYTDASNATTVYKCSTTVTDETTQENTTITFWFVQIKSGETVTQYPADIDTKTTITLDGTPVDLDDLEQVTQKKNVKKEVQTYVKGTEVTLTASLKDNNTGEPILADNDKVVFKIVNSVGDGSATVTATATNGTATATWTPTAAGVYTITAAYEGNEKYMGSVSGQTITINVVVPEQKTLMIDSPNSMTYGDAAIELKTTLLKGAKNSESASVETKLNGVTYSVKNADGTAVPITGSTFDPTAAGTYTVTATYTIGSETLTATKSIVVNKRTVTIVPKVEGTGTTKTATYSLANCMTSDESLFTNKIQVTCAGTAPNAVAGEYPYTVTYTPGENEAAINSKYIVVIDTMHPYVLKDDMVTVTDKTSSNNGTVTLRYRSSSTDSYVDVYGDSVPKNAEVIAVASPKAGYRVKQWKVDEQAVTTGEGGTLNTAQTITVAQSATTNHTVEAEFELVYHTLSFEVTDGSKQTGTVTAKYLKDSVESGTFVSGKRVSYFDRVQLTAKVNDGLSIKEWRITRNNGTPETLKIENEVYTGNSYVLSSITADTKVTVVTENQTACMVNIHLVNTNGEPLTRGQVAFNGATQEVNPQGTFTYSGHKNDNLTVALTLPSGLVVDEWLRKDDETNTSSALQIGSFSNNKTTWNIVNLPTSLDLTVKCSTPNSYTITKSTIVQSGTEDETGGTIEVYQIGRGDQVNAVLQGSDLLVKVKPVNGYQLLDVTCNNTSQMSQMGSGNEFRINGVNENIIIVATFVKKPVVTFTAGSKGTIEVSNGPSVNGGTVPYGYKNDIVFTAKPEPGNEVDSWTVTGVTDPQGTPVANSDNQTYTYTPNAETGITDDLTVTVSFKALPKATVEFSVVDKGSGGFDGTIQATVTRNGQSTTSNKVTSDTLTNVYRDSKVTFAAEPAAGYKVTKWLVGNREQPTPPVLDIVEGDDGTTKTVQVQFEKISNEIAYEIDPTSDTGHGATLNVTFLANTGTPSPENVPSGNSVKGPGVLTATVNDLNDGYEIESWTLNGAPYTPDENGKLTCNVSETQGADIKVKIVRKSYQITFSATKGGTITAKVDETALTSPASVKGDKQVTFTASTPETGYEFVGWKVDEETVQSNSDPYVLTVSKNTSVQACYALTTAKYQVTYGIIQTEGQENGTLAVSGLDSSGKANAGSDITFTATPAAGYQVKQWYNAATSGTEIGAAESTTYKIKNLTANASVYVQFEPIPTYNITVNVSGQGSVTATVNRNPATITNNMLEVKRHDSVVLTAEPEEGHHLKEWTGGTASQENPLTLTLSDVTAPHAITANFEVNQGVPFQTICGTGGSLEAKAGYGNNLQPIKADTGIQVDNGKKIVLTAKPDNGKAVVWTVNNQLTNELSNTYTIDAISENTTVKADFVALELCTIPQNSDTSADYTISEVTKYPKDYGTDGQIRKGGTVSFKLTPKKPVMGLQGLPENAKVVYNSDGSYTVTVTNVTSNIAVTATAYQVEAKGLNDYVVPKSLKDVNLNSITDIKTKLETNLTGRKNGTVFYDIVLKTADGNVVSGDNFPANGVYVTIPYPTGTDKQDTFQILHMLTATKDGKQPGDVEEITPVTKGTNGISFHVTSLSPFAIGWTKYVAPTPGGGGGGGGAVSTCTLTFDTNGGSAIDKITKDSGTTIDLAAYKPTRAGYTFAGWFSDKALTKAVTSVKLTANTTVYAKWTQSGTAENPFVDVKEGAYYYDAVLWAVEQKITSGTSATTFSPDASCTRAQMVTFLWRAAGSPKVENGKNPFTDVKADAYYYDAVLWAVEKGVTSGTSATTFSPDATVTRGQTVTFLYRNAGSPEVSGTMPFTDVEADAYYAKAVQWAVQQKITTGTSETTFSPMSDCTRGQIVTFLYRAK